MTHPWREIERKMSPARLARVRALVRRELFRIQYNRIVYRVIFWFQKYVFFWSICTECQHPNRWHTYSGDDSHPYCWPKPRRVGNHCACGYHTGR
jgi:hypothetical protein